MHWADVIAQALEKKGKKHLIASGITPSGEFHIGHLREILTGDRATRAGNTRGLEAEAVFIVDSPDPLRKVYPFLSDDIRNISVILLLRFLLQIKMEIQAMVK